MTTFNEQMKQMICMMEEHSKTAKFEEQQVNYIQDTNIEKRKALYKQNKEKILQKKKEKYQNKKETLIYNNKKPNDYKWFRKEN